MEDYNDISKNAIDNRSKTEANEIFQRWLSKPETKMILSLIPSTENSEMFQLLLRSAFDAGFSGGQGNVMIEIVRSMVHGEKRR